MKYVFLSLALVLSVLGQDAKVVQLSKADAEHAKAAYEAMKKAEADWQATQTEIEHKYVSDSSEQEDFTSGTGIVYGSSSINAVNPIFECADKGAYLVYKDGALAPSSENADCLKAKEKREAEGQLARAKAKRESEHRPKHTVYSPKDGWHNGFTFSPDFQFIVPKPAPIPTNNGGSWFTPSWGGSSTWAIPADGAHTSIYQ